MEPGARRKVSTGLGLTLVRGLLGAGCQSALSGEEASKQVPAAFADTPVTPRPRTVTDIIGLLDRRQPDDTASAVRRLAEEAPPGARLEDLADFYLERGQAAGRLGRAKQEIDDLTRASEYRRQTVSPVGYFYYRLALAEERGGNFFHHLRYLQKIYRNDALHLYTANGGTEGMWVRPNARLAIAYASIGHVQAAEAALNEAARHYYQTAPTYRGGVGEIYAQAQAVLLDVTGRHAEAEALSRNIIARLATDRQNARSTWMDEMRAFVAGTLIRQGRLLEAENEARQAALGALAQPYGRYSPHTAWMLRSLTWVLLEQGRYREAETLAHAVIDIYEKTQTAPDSLRFATARADLASALELQGRDQESLGEYEAIRANLSRDPESLNEFFTGNVRYAELLLKTGRVDRALEQLEVALERSKRLVGEVHRETAEIPGSLARAYAVKGDRRRALHEFHDASALLTTRAPDGEATSVGATRRLVGILNSYIDLLAAIEGSPLAREAGIDAIAESF